MDVAEYTELQVLFKRVYAVLVEEIIEHPKDFAEVCFVRALVTDDSDRCLEDETPARPSFVRRRISVLLNPEYDALMTNELPGDRVT